MSETDESRILFGSCLSVRDAEDFITIKQSIDEWKCLVRPFPLEFITIAISQPGTTAMLYHKVPSAWGFVLHKFFS